jgi:UDP-N-acetylmuramoyl-L-alanyl-D-glutamate--2,6-diaminopimelate ligase
MILGEVIKGIETLNISGDIGIDITGLAYDSRKVGKGDLFFALPGEHADGHRFIRQAVESGAAAVVCERPGDDFGDERPAPGVALMLVRDSREALARAANNFFRRPSGSLQVIGITGTNGKTTTTYLLKAILEEWGQKVGLIGTIQYLIETRSTTRSIQPPRRPSFRPSCMRCWYQTAVMLSQRFLRMPLRRRGWTGRCLRERYLRT